MHERQAVALVVAVLLFSVSYFTESFAQTLQCNGLDATHVGTDKKDRIRGTSGDDVIVGLGGNDKIYGRGGNDVICGGDGNDNISGGSGNDVIIGGKGIDKLYGGTGIDICDASSEDKRVISCETKYEETTSDSEDTSNLQKQINELKNKISSMILGIINWDDIQGIPESFADGDDDMLSKINCEEGQILVFDDNRWVCDDVNVQVSNIPQSCSGEMINFAGLSHGDSLDKIQEKLSTHGITLSATAYGNNAKNTVIIYNSNQDDGQDSDLEVGIGNLAIIPDNIDNPSDSAKGGKQIYEFSPTKNLESLVIVDIESDEAGMATAYDVNGEVLVNVKLPETGNKSYQTVWINAKDVAKLIVDYDSSGGLTDICISENENSDVLQVECTIDQILMHDGVQWVCADLPDTNSANSNSSPIFFHHVRLNGGETKSTGMLDSSNGDLDKISFLIPTDGALSNLFAKLGSSGDIGSTRVGEKYTMTIIKNEIEDTVLTCSITELVDYCNSGEILISVSAGDTIFLKVESSNAAPLAVIRSSILFQSQ